MEMHHRLRRDPNWHKDACNLCGQLGHQAANCTSGTVNWRQIYGDREFILRPPQYWSDELALKKARTADVKAIEKAAAEYARGMAAQQGLDFDDILKKGRELHEQDAAETVAKAVAAARAAVAQAAGPPLPAGWASAVDAQGRTYFYHKVTKKTQWERPVEDAAAPSEPAAAHEPTGMAVDAPAAEAAVELKPELQAVEFKHEVPAS